MFLNQKCNDLRTLKPQSNLIELTDAAASIVSGGTLCSRDPGFNLVMYMATGGLIRPTQDGAFTCWA